MHDNVQPLSPHSPDVSDGYRRPDPLESALLAAWNAGEPEEIDGAPAHADETPACGVRKPGWEHGPAIGRHRIPCTLPAGHEGGHRDALGQTWPNERHNVPRLVAGIPDAIREALQTVMPDRYTPEVAEQIAADVVAELEADRTGVLTEEQTTLVHDAAGGWDQAAPIETPVRDIDADAPHDGPFLQARLVVQPWDGQTAGPFTRIWLSYGESIGELEPGKARQVAQEMREFADRLTALCDRAEETVLLEECRDDYRAAEERRRAQDHRDDAGVAARAGA